MHRRDPRLVFLLPMMITLIGGACTKTPAGPESKAAEGRKAYVINCASCHNMNPALDGSIGPAIAGSSRALIEARVLHQAYPPGYTPRRTTHLMRAMPWLAPTIDDLMAFLADTKQKQK